MDLPRVLILSTIPGETNKIASKMGAEHLSNQDDIDYYSWNIDNKYYTSKILLCGTANPQTKVSTENVEAVIIHHDPQTENSEENLNQWSSLINLLPEAEVLLLSCTTITNSIVRDKVTDWCIKNKFELVEASSNHPTDTMDFELAQNKCGIDRIVEALQSHMWPNMILKTSPSAKTSNVEAVSPDLDRVEEQLDNIHLNPEVSDRLQMESVLDGIMGGEDTDFAELFGQLMAMKEHAASLPSNQRRIAAEQLVTAFWKAMGGDPSEIEE